MTVPPRPRTAITRLAPQRPALHRRDPLVQRLQEPASRWRQHPVRRRLGQVHEGLDQRRDLAGHWQSEWRRSHQRGQPLKVGLTVSISEREGRPPRSVFTSPGDREKWRSLTRAFDGPAGRESR